MNIGDKVVFKQRPTSRDHSLRHRCFLGGTGSREDDVGEIIDGDDQNGYSVKMGSTEHKHFSQSGMELYTPDLKKEFETWYTGDVPQVGQIVKTKNPYNSSERINRIYKVSKPKSGLGILFFTTHKTSGMNMGDPEVLELLPYVSKYPLIKTKT